MVGAGHAGCEAALANARMGRKTLLLTMNLDSIALMPCNPSMGWAGKGHLMKEIDALGGEIGRNTDRTFIQIRLLNTSKGPAVQALRRRNAKASISPGHEICAGRPAQPGTETGHDHALYAYDEVRTMAARRMHRVITTNGWHYDAAAIILTTGTFINGRLVVGEKTRPGGRAGEAPALGISDALPALGLESAPL